MDEHIEQHLKRVIASGDAILFTGAGFSREARDASGRELPAGRDLGKEIWSLAFPKDAYDEYASLQDVFAAAKQVNSSSLKRLLEQRLRADPRNLPEFYQRYMNVDWATIYTLNIDNVLEVAAAAAGRDIGSVSALSNSSPIARPDAITHLNGVLKEYPNVTFTADDFAARTARHDAHYIALASRLAQSSVIYVGTELEESPLWHHIAARGERPEGRELRPRSYLVSPTLGVAKRAALKRHNVFHIPLSARRFAELYLPGTLPDHLRGNRTAPQSSWSNVSTVRATPIERPADFLLGRGPQWGDVAQGFAVQRSFEPALVQKIAAPAVRVAVVSGTVGSGKSTTLRGLALSLDTEGRKTLWLERSGSDSLSEIARQARANEAAFVFIDDAERFAGRINTLVAALNQPEADAPVVVLATPTTHRGDLDLDELGLSEEQRVDFYMPHLDDADIDALLDSLTQARRLGVLAGKTREVQRRAFREVSKRQLLVALLEATSGRRFEEMIDAECDHLQPSLAYAYAVCAIATVHGYRIPKHDFLTAIGGGATALQDIDALDRQRLIFKTADNRYVTRHPLIAERVVHHFKMTGQLVQPYCGLVFTMASKFQPYQRQTGERRLLTALLNHDYLQKLFDDREDARSVFVEAEGLLSEDAHYWLQRGSYELEVGDIPAAENFLSQARSLGEGDYMIDTEWSYLRLRQATAESNSARAAEYGNEALSILFDVIQQRGSRTPNTYAVLLQDGMAWLQKSNISEVEKRFIMSRMHSVMQEGRDRHPGNVRLRVAAQAFERAYLMQATIKE